MRSQTQDQGNANVKRQIFNGLLGLALIFLSGCSLLLTPDQSRDALELKYLTPESDMTTISGTQLHVRDTGPDDAPVIILLHGIGSHLQTWDGWVDTLETEFRTVRFDLPGAGLSPPDSSGDYTDARALVLILSLMDELEIERASLIGNSLGGRVAWKFAAAHPNRTEKLVLVAPDGFASPQFQYDQKADIPFILTLVRFALPKWLIKRTLSAAFSDQSKLNAETLQRYFDLLHAPGVRRALIDRMRQTVLTPPVPILSELEPPVLLIWGEDDRIIPVETATEFLQAISDSKLITLTGVGHLPQEEAPETSIEPVLAFLRTP